MLFVLSLVPQTMSFHDVLPAMLVANTFRQSLVLGLLSQTAFLLSRNEMTTQRDMATMFHNTAPLALWLMYVPALVLILLRPNVGDVGKLFESLSRRLPAWARGAPGDASEALAPAAVRAD